MSNLAYKSEYNVKVSPIKLVVDSKFTRRVIDDSISSLENKDNLLTGSFLSLSCFQIFGRGSLECGKIF